MSPSEAKNEHSASQSLPKPGGIDDIINYMCSLAMAKCAKKSEKKRASCGGAAMRKRLLIKNFVACMLDQERQMSPNGCEMLTREMNIAKGIVPANSPLITTRSALIAEEVEEEPMEEELDEALEEEDTDMGVEGDDEEEEEEEPEEEEEEDEAREEEDEDRVNAVAATATAADRKLPGLDATFAQSAQPPPSTSATAVAAVATTVSPFFAASPIAALDEELTEEEEASDGGYSLFGQSAVAYSSASLLQSGTTVVHSVAMPPTSAPSWRETEPDLYMLGRSSSPQQFFDDYGSASARDYTLLSNEEFPVASGADLYPVCGESFMISGYSSPLGASTVPVTTVAASALNSGSAITAVAPLPENFMDEAEQPTSGVSTSGGYVWSEAQLGATSPPMTYTSASTEFAGTPVLVQQQASYSFDSYTAATDADFGSWKFRTEKSERADSTLVDLVNRVPSLQTSAPTAVAKPPMDCRAEARCRDAAAVVALHDYQHCITDLDTNTVVVENRSRAELEVSSPRKRHSSLCVEYESHGILLSASPKRIKL